MSSAPIVLTLPLAFCPNALSKNGRAHWSARYRAMRDQRQWAEYALLEADGQADWPWPAAVMDVEWRYHRGRPPDDDNVWARVAGARDAFQARGVVRDDRDIRTGSVTYTHVPLDEAAVVVRLHRLEERT